MKHTKLTGGYLLITILILGSLGAAGTIGLISFANQNLLAARKAVESEQALQAAEAGLELYRQYLNNGGIASATSSTSTLFDGSGLPVGEYQITVTGQLGRYNLSSRGTSGVSVRTIEAGLVQGEGFAFHYGVQGGNGGFTLGNGAQIVGNVYSNKNITGGNNSSITGDASAVGTISGVSVGGHMRTGVSVEPLPIPDEVIAQWKEEAPQKINGNLTLNNNQKLTLTGSLWITGNLTLGNNAVIELSPSFGSSGSVVIVDGSVSAGNGVTLRGSGQTESFLLLISLSQSSAISMGNNFTADILYAPKGKISVGNGANIGSLAADNIDIGNNITLVYESGLPNALFTSGPSGSWRMENWREIR